MKKKKKRIVKPALPQEAVTALTSRLRKGGAHLDRAKQQNKHACRGPIRQTHD